MTVTPFGLIFITLGFTLLVARPAWLLPLLIVSAVLHAFAVAVIGTMTVPLGQGTGTISFGLGITPWLLTCSLILVHLIAIIICNQRIKLELSRPAKLLFWGWMIFIGWCVVSAFTLPFIFDGTPVHSLSNWEGFDGSMTPLVWNRINAVQAAHSVIIGMLLIYVLQLSEDRNMANRLMTGLIAAILISISITFYQRLELSGIISAPIDIMHLSLNPAYKHGGSPERINWPFSEPSYAGAWYSGVLMGGLVTYLFTNYLWSGASLVFAGLLMLLASRGGAGFAGSALALLVLTTASAVILWKGKISLRPILWRLTFMSVVIGLVAISYKIGREKMPIIPDIYSVIHSIVQERISGPISFRGQSNLDAITITKDTWSLGGGLGSNRASSYLLSMMSNIGVPGLALFLILLTYQSYLIAFYATTSSALKALLVGGTIGMFFGMAMGVPDLMFPAWWIWLIAGFGFFASNQHFRPIQSD